MPKKPEWVSRTKERILAATNSGLLNGHEDLFLADILRLIDKHGVNVELTDAQENRLIQHLAKAERDPL